MPSTTNFGWTTPADTDLVKDGAAAIRTLGNGVDASFVDLKGGTTGQILSKNSNTDLDFTWIANDQGDITAVTAGTGLTGGGTAGAVTLTNDMATTITASGDIVVGTGSGTYDNLPIGTTGQVLTADTTVSPYKVKWADAGGGLKKYTLLNTGGTTLTGAQTITISGISNQQSLFIRINAASSANASSEMKVRFNTDSNNNYNSSGIRFNPNGPAITVYDDSPSNGVILGSLSSNAASQAFGALLAFGTNGDGIISFTSSGGATTGGGSDPYCFNFTGTYSGSAAITSVSIFSTTGNLDNGTVYVYGMAA